MLVKPKARWLAAAAVAVSCLAAGGLVATAAPAAASGPTFQAGPFPVGNRMSYANSDFEGGAANFIPVANAAISNSTSTAVMHSGSLLDTVGSGGASSSFQLQEGAGPTQINIAGGNSYTLGAYFKASAASGQSVKFGLDLYAGGTEIGWSYTPLLALTGSGGWQYVQGVISTPQNATNVLDSPKITLSGVSAGEQVHMDYLLFEPTRAATAIGAHGDACLDNTCGNYTATDWLDSDGVGYSGLNIAPLQSDKEFSGDADLPSNFDQTNCYGIEQALGTNQRTWPVCVITWHTTTMTQTSMDNFLSTVPAGQELYLVWHGEPENDSFTSQPGCPKLTGGKAYVCEFGVQEGLVKASPYDTPNIFTAADSSAYQYGNPGGPTGTNGDGCGFIPPNSIADLYLLDHYEHIKVDGSNLAASSDEGVNWTTWLNCVTPRNRPVGLAEYGLDQSTASNPHTPCGSNAQCTPAAMAADDTYLQNLPATIGEPVALWEYWWSDNSLFDNLNNAQTQWVSIETENGGG